MDRRTVLGIAFALIAGCKPAPAPWVPPPGIPKEILIQLTEAEDTRTWTADTMAFFLRDLNPSVRSRTALAAGRIGNEEAIPQLAEVLRADKSTEVAAMAAFAIGEIESATGVPPLLETLAYSPLLET